MEYTQRWFLYLVEITGSIKSTKIFKKSVKKGVAFVNGKTFDPASKKDDRLRLSFSNMPKEDIEKGTKILAKIIKKVINETRLEHV